MKFKPVRFPQDGGAHKSIIEWWYFNGHLKDSAGRNYAFMDCLFKADLSRVDIPLLKLPFRKSATRPYVYFAHSVISDLTKRKTYKDIQNISFMSSDSFRRPLLNANYLDPLAIPGGYVNCEMTEIAPNKFRIKNAQLDLTLAAQKSPLLEGGRAFIDVCGRKSYYYSLTDLTAAGSLNLAGKEIKVTGRAWMDHQWADVAYSHDAWNWFSLQLSDGTDIMVIEYKVNEQRAYLVDIIDARGQATHYTKVLLKPSAKTWRSPQTKARYPLEWAIEIPQSKIKLKVEAAIGNQEMIFGAINYWEGPTKIRGSVKGQAVTGHGFMELVGYASNYNFLALAGAEFNHKLRRAAIAKIKKIL